MATLALGLLGALALAVWAVLVEPRRLVVRRRTLHLARWPRSLHGLRLGLIADLHAGAPAIDPARVARVAQRMQAERPDLIALLGDFVDPEVPGGRPVAPEAVAEPLARLTAPLGVLAVLGNHDWRAGGRRVRGALGAEAIRVLENEAVQVREGLWVAGVTDPRRRPPDLYAALGGVPDGATALLLAHDPDVFPRIPSRVALTVAGHTHGGQVNLPVLRARAIPSRYGARYAAGHVQEGGRDLFVTSGVGTSTWPVRFLRPPEIVVLELRSAA